MVPSITKNHQVPQVAPLTMTSLSRGLNEYVCLLGFPGLDASSIPTPLYLVLTPPFLLQCKKASVCGLGWQINFCWIPREQNEECDAL